MALALVLGAAACGGAADPAGSPSMPVPPVAASPGTFLAELDDLCGNALTAQTAHLDRPEADEGGLLEIHLLWARRVAELPAPHDAGSWPDALRALHREAVSARGDGEGLLSAVWPFIGAAALRTS